MFSLNLFNIVFMLIFAMIIITFVIMIVRGLTTWNKNNHSPRLSVDATIVAKRADVSTHHGGTNDTGYHTSSSTRYYVTFQFDSGDRLELQIIGNEYGMLIEGDRGKLSFQGTRYLGFERA